MQDICDELRDLVAFVQFKNVKNTHGGVLLLVLKAALLHGWFLRSLKLQYFYLHLPLN